MLSNTVTLFIRGLSSSLDIAPALSILSASKTARRRIGNVFALNSCLIVVDLLVSHRYLQVASRAIFEALTGRSVASAHAAASIDAIAFACLYILAVIPLLLSTLICTSRWNQQISRDAHNARAKGPPLLPASSEASSGDFLKGLVESMFQPILILIMTLHAALLDSLPLVGRGLALGLTAVITGFSAIDIGRWGQAQVPVRLAALEAGWAYYAGFGALTAGASYFFSPGVNLGIYGILSVPLTLVAVCLTEPSAPELHVPLRSNPLPILLPFKWSVILIMQQLTWCWSRRRARLYSRVYSP